MDKYKLLKTIFMAVIVIALGMVILNQSMGYFFKTKLLLTPCELCKKDNPNMVCSNYINPQTINLSGEFILPKP